MEGSSSLSGGWWPTGNSYGSTMLNRDLLDLSMMAGVKGAAYGSFIDFSKPAYSLPTELYGSPSHCRPHSKFEPAACYSGRGSQPPRAAKSYRALCSETEQSSRGGGSGPIPGWRSLKKAWESDPSIAPRTRALINRDFQKWRHGSGKVYALQRKLYRIDEGSNVDCVSSGVQQHRGEMPKLAGPSCRVQETRESNLKPVVEAEVEMTSGYCTLMTSFLQVVAGSRNSSRGCMARAPV